MANTLKIGNALPIVIGAIVMILKTRPTNVSETKAHKTVDRAEKLLYWSMPVSRRFITTIFVSYTFPWEWRFFGIWTTPNIGVSTIVFAVSVRSRKRKTDARRRKKRRITNSGEKNDVHTCRCYNAECPSSGRPQWIPAKRILSRASRHCRLLSRSPVTDSTGCSVERYGKHATNDTPPPKVERREINNEIFGRIINTKPTPTPVTPSTGLAGFPCENQTDSNVLNTDPETSAKTVVDVFGSIVMDAWCTKPPYVRRRVVYRFSNKNPHYAHRW